MRCPYNRVEGGIALGHRERWRTAGIVLAVGAVYDLVFGVAILGFLRPAASILGLPIPDDPVYLYLNGVFLLLLGSLLVAAARQPERYRAVAPISAGGRMLGVILFLWAWMDGRPVGFLVLGLGDLGLAVATFATWRRAVALSD
jgi:hypothetical protein